MVSDLSSDSTPWRVLLIGGCSGVGKTVVAQVLGKQLGISSLLVDDIRIALQAVTDAQQAPALHYFLRVQEPAHLPTARFVAGLIGVGRTLTPALQAIVAHHVAVAGAGRIILEGDGILPALVSGLTVRGVCNQPVAGLDNLVKVVFIDEPDEEVLLANFVQRNRGFNVADDPEQRAYVHSVWQFGRWLASEAERAGLPLTPSRPFATAAERVLAAVNNGAAMKFG